MVKRGGSSVLPRVTQQLGTTQESAIGQESRLIKNAIFLDSIRMETLKPRPFAWAFFAFIFSLFIYIITGTVKYLHKEPILSVDHLFFCFLAYIGLSLIASFIYKQILDDIRKYSIFVYATIYTHSFFYIIVPIIIEIFFPNISFIFYFAAAMISEYWVSTVLTQEIVFPTNKKMFLFRLSTFLLQFLGVILIGRSMNY